jgi:hypothetical protein
VNGIVFPAGIIKLPRILRRLIEAVVSSMHFMNNVADNALKFLRDQESNRSNYGGENKELGGLNPDV